MYFSIFASYNIFVAPEVKNTERKNILVDLFSLKFFQQFIEW